MRIVELKSQNVKIIYKPTQHQLKVGDFVSFTEGDLTLIAQIYKILSSPEADDFNQADMSFVMSHKYGKTYAWNGETLSLEANVYPADKNIIENYINQNKTEKNFIIGNYLEFPENALELSPEKFKTPAFVGFEKVSDNKNLLEIFAPQFLKLDKKLLIIDFKGDLQIAGAQKILAGFQAKLPLNGELLENLCTKILDGVSLESRVVIEDVLLEVAKYAKESKNGFIPLSHFINVIDDIYKKSKISQLILLKNKLRKYQRLNLFADKLKEVYAVFEAVEENTLTVFDVSNVPLEWQKEFFAEIIGLNNQVKKEFYLFATLDEQNSDNKIINNLLFKAQNTGIKPILSSNYRYLSFENLFDFSKNIFLFKTYNALKKRANIPDILQALPNDCFMLTGKLTNDLMLCARLKDHEKPIEEATQEEFSENFSNKIENFQKITLPEEEVHQIEEVTTPITNIDMSVLNTALKPEPSMNLQTPKINAPINETLLQNEEEDLQKIEENQTEEEQIPEQKIVELVEEEPLPQKTQQAEKPAPTPAIIEETPQQIEPTANLFEEVDTEEPIEEMPEIAEDIPMEMPQKIEKMQTLDEPEIEDLDLDDLDFLNENEALPTANNQQPNEDEDLLDLLEENNAISQNENNETQLIEDIDFDEFEEISNSAPQPAVMPEQKLPIYNADYEKKENKTKQDFQEGDLVKHQKYGVGTVKKITAHGEKILCHINFDDFGRRLLDPDISQLQKL